MKAYPCQREVINLSSDMPKRIDCRKFAAVKQALGGDGLSPACLSFD